MDDLLLNLFIVFEACRIKGMTTLQATEATKQLVIRPKCGEISALIVRLYIALANSGSDLVIQLEKTKRVCTLPFAFKIVHRSGKTGRPGLTRISGHEVVVKGKAQ